MTRDHDPRELREAAARYFIQSNGGDGSDLTEMAAYILANVCDDDGEEQPDVTVSKGDDAIRVNVGGVWLIECTAGTQTIDRVIRLNINRPTRGQFRDLCRGLGIVIE